MRQDSNKKMNQFFNYQAHHEFKSWQFFGRNAAESMVSFLVSRLSSESNSTAEKSAWAES